MSKLPGDTPHVASSFMAKSKCVVRNRVHIGGPGWSPTLLSGHCRDHMSMLKALMRRSRSPILAAWKSSGISMRDRAMRRAAQMLLDMTWWLLFFLCWCRAVRKLLTASLKGHHSRSLSATLKRVHKAQEALRLHTVILRPGKKQTDCFCNSMC